MQGIGITEILIIAGIILLIFGAGRISKVAGEMGKGIRAFKDGISGKDEVKDAGKTGKVQVVSFDFVDETMQYVQKGVIDGTIGQDPFAQGHDPAIRLYNYIVGGVVPDNARLVTKADFVTKDNIDQFWKPTQ